MKQYEYVEVVGGVKITKYLGESKEVVIPSEIDGLPVVSIGGWALSDNNLTTVTLSEGLVSIGEWTFGDSIELKLGSVLNKNSVIKKLAPEIGKTGLPKEYNYTPIPKVSGVKIGQSSVHGLGIVAIIDLPCCWLVGMTHSQKTYRQLHDKQLGLVCPGKLIRHPIGAFINHSDNPNCMLVEDSSNYFLVTLEKVGVGEELTIDYNKYLCGGEDCEENITICQ